MAEEEFEIEITYPAELRYQQEVLTYLLKNFSLKRALEINDNIFVSIKSISKMPKRGGIEPILKKYSQQFRYLLHKETRNFQIKIIYYIEPSIRKIYVTDFFPVLMLPEKIKERN